MDTLSNPMCHYGLDKATLQSLRKALRARVPDAQQYRDRRNALYNAAMSASGARLINGDAYGMPRCTHDHAIGTAAGVLCTCRAFDVAVAAARRRRVLIERLISDLGD